MILASSLRDQLDNYIKQYGDHPIKVEMDGWDREVRSCAAISDNNSIIGYVILTIQAGPYPTQAMLDALQALVRNIHNILEGPAL